MVTKMMKGSTLLVTKPLVCWGKCVKKIVYYKQKSVITLFVQLCAVKLRIDTHVYVLALVKIPVVEIIKIGLFG